MLLRRRLAETIIIMLTVAGCSGDQPPAAGRRTAVGTTLGAIAGGAAGAVIDKNDLRGPLIGAAIGAAVGGGIGYALDRQQAELEQALERERASQQAMVERVSDDQLKVMAMDITRPELVLDGGPPVRIRIGINGMSDAKLARLQEVLADHPGDSPVYVHLESPEKTTVLRLGDDLVRYVERPRLL